MPGVLLLLKSLSAFVHSSSFTNPSPSSETQGSNGDGTGRERLGAGKRWGEGGRERGKGKPWEASLYRSFLDQLLF